jgi:hypothetical protein
MAYYILCGWLPLNFVVNFCVVTFLLVCDFWTVRRLLLHYRPQPNTPPPPPPNPLSLTTCRARSALAYT